MAIKCNTIPPMEIYDVLHAAESCNILIPESVRKWWKKEKAINEALRKQLLKLGNRK